MSKLLNREFHIQPFIRLTEQMKCSGYHPEAICCTGCVSARFQGHKTHYACCGRQTATKEQTNKVVVKSEETAPFVDEVGFINAAENDVGSEDQPFCDFAPVGMAQMLRINADYVPGLTFLDFRSQFSTGFASFGDRVMAVRECRNIENAQFLNLGKPSAQPEVWVLADLKKYDNGNCK